MIDFLNRIPDFLIGPAIAASLWFGFNYTVLADRAMEGRLEKEIVPQCARDLEGAERNAGALNLPTELIPNIEGFDFRGLVETFQSRFRLSNHQRWAICLCSARQATKSVRFDYAVHTASFRLIEPASVSGLRRDVHQVVKSQTCGALPWLTHGG